MAKKAEKLFNYTSFMKKYPDVRHPSSWGNRAWKVFDRSFSYNYLIKKKSLQESIRLAIKQVKRLPMEEWA